MRPIVVVVVALLAVFGYANRPQPAPVVVATATQVRVPLRVVTSTRVPARSDEWMNCQKTPSQCSWQNGQPDWTTPAYGCDWNYGTILHISTKPNNGKQTACVPDQQGDFDCPDLRAMGLRNIRVVGDDWMLLDEDGDGVGCDVRTPFDRLAEEAGCESLDEPERTACRDELVADLEEQLDRQRAEESRYDDDQYDDRDRDDERDIDAPAYDEPYPLR